MQKTLYFLLICSLTSCLLHADVLMLENFEDNTTNFVASDGLFHDGSSDYFTIVPLNGAPNPESAYTGFAGAGYFAAEDIDDGATRPFAQTLVFNIDITNFETLTLDAMFAAGGNASPSYDSSTFLSQDDHIIFRASIDGGAFQNLLAFEAEGDPNGPSSNQFLRRDTDFDGVGDGFLPSSAFLSYNGLAISGTGTNLVLEIEVASTDGGSEFAFDNITINGIQSVPEPSSILICAMVTPLLAMRRRRHRSNS